MFNPMLNRLATLFRRKSADDSGTWRNLWNGWQTGGEHAPNEYAKFAPVYACVRIIAEEIARTPWYITSEGKDGRRVKVFETDAARVLARPNSYQTESDFKLQLVHGLLFTGNGVGFTTLNERNGVSGLHLTPWGATEPFIDPQDGAVYYSVGDQDATTLARINQGYWFPQRRMFHVRLFTPHHPLKGETPLTAAAASINTGLNIGRHTTAFFANMARPSGVLDTLKPLTPLQVESIKAQFVEAATKSNSGAPVVLHSGLAWKPQTMTAVDADVIKTYNLSERAVAQIFRVPPYLLGDLEDAKFSSVEQLMRYFVLNGLGFYFEHIAQQFTALFNLRPNERVEFDIENALLRGDLGARMEAYGKAIQGGLAVNEVRAKENLPPVDGGDVVRLQAQMTPINPPVNEPAPQAKAVTRYKVLADLEKRMAA